MGIGNTTSAAILTGLMCGADANTVTGRGTGLADDQMPNKLRVVAESLNRLSTFTDQPMECLRQSGGLEIAALVGAMLEAPTHKLPVVVDGFIVTAAALIACKINPVKALDNLKALAGFGAEQMTSVEQLTPEQQAYLNTNIDFFVNNCGV